MESFARLAVFTLVRDTAFVALAAMMVMAGTSFRPAVALTSGAGFALGHAAVLALRAGRLTPARLIKSEPWRALYAHQRAALSQSRDRACAYLAALRLTFAEGSAAIAAGLSIASLALRAIGMSE